MFYLIHSREFEALEDALLGRLMQSNGNPFASEPVLVGSAGMKRALELAVTRRFGVAAAIEFGFPGQWLWAQVAQVIPECPADSPFSSERLVWRILHELNESKIWRNSPRLYHYLEDADALMRYELALLIAKTFDRYLTYRPDWLERWGAGQSIPELSSLDQEDEAWQAELWRRVLHALVKDGVLGVAEHPARVFIEVLKSAQARGDRVLGGDSIHVFCVSSLPPLYLHWFRGLGELMEVYFYVLTPTSEYWHDLVSEKTLLKKIHDGTEAGFEVGHRLLSSWGVAPQSYHRLLAELEGTVEMERPPISVRPPSLLSAVQASIHSLEDLTPGSLAHLHADDSLQVHVCHRLVRSLEVLHDRLLTLFKNDDTLEPKDVLVLLPHLDDAIPVIEAVFGAQSGLSYIPFTLTGAAPQHQSPLVDAFLKVLQLARSRCTRQEVFDVLRLDLIRARFHLDDDDLLTLERGFDEAGTRWGLGSQHRESLGVPPSAHHTFDDGVERLILGYALSQDPSISIGGQLPSYGLEGEALVPFAYLGEFIGCLKKIQGALLTSKTGPEWFDFLASLVTTITPPEAGPETEAAALLKELSLATNAMTGYEGLIEADVVMMFLETRLGTAPRGGVPTGAVTFTTISGLRHIPYRWIAILGLDDQVFPRVYRPLEFDLTRSLPRPGDPREDQEDKALFLDALMSAREGLILMYSGFEPRDNTVRSPSILLDELLEALVPAMAPPGADEKVMAAVRRKLVEEHHLQPFHPDDFKAEDPKTFRADWLEALYRLHDESGRELHPFVSPHERLPLPPEREITLQDLIRFFKSPSQVFLKTTLGIEYPRLTTDSDEDEDLVPRHSAERRLAKRVLPLLIEGASSDRLQEVVDAGDEYPKGVWGDRARARIIRRLEAWGRDIVSERGSVSPETLASQWEVMIRGERWLFSGEVGDCFADRRVVTSWDDPYVFESIAVWLQHLFLNAVRGDIETHIVSSEKGRTELPGLSTNDARQTLETLLTLYVEGLERPLPFFPKSAWATRSAKTPEEALNKARSEWRGSDYDRRTPESLEPVYRLAFRGIDEPIDEEFLRLTAIVLQPFLSAQEESE